MVRLLPPGPRPRHPGPQVGRLRPEPARGAAAAARARPQRPDLRRGVRRLPALLLPRASACRAAGGLRRGDRRVQPRGAAGRDQEDAAARRPHPPARARRRAREAGAHARRRARGEVAAPAARGAGARPAQGAGTRRCALPRPGGGARQRPRRGHPARVTREQERLRAAQTEAADAAARAPAPRAAPRRRRSGCSRRARPRRPSWPSTRRSSSTRATRGRSRGAAVAEERILGLTTRAARRKAFADGKALFDAGQYEQALGPLTDAAADPASAEARDLLARARQVLEGLRQQKELRAEIDRAGRARRGAHGGRPLPRGAGGLRVACCGSTRATPAPASGWPRPSGAPGEALFARWLPNREPTPGPLRARGRAVVEAPTPPAAGRRHGRPRASEGRVPRRAAGWSASSCPRSSPGEPGAQRALRPGAAPRAGRQRDRGDRLRHRRALALGLVPRASGGCASTRRGGSCPSAAGGRRRPRRASAGARSALRRRRAMRRRFNPYIAGAPVLDDDMFYGREKLTARMLSTLHRNSLMITGERRIGKTTFLHHLKRVLAEDEAGEWRFFPVFVDLQGVPEQAFFHALMAEVVDALDLSPATREALRFAPEPEGYDARDFSHDLQQVIAELQDPHRPQGQARPPHRRGGRAQRVLGERQPAPARHLHEELLGEPRGGHERGRHPPALEERGQPLVQLLRRDRAAPLLARGGRGPGPGAGGRASSAGSPRRSSGSSSCRSCEPYLVQKLCVHAVNRMLEEGRSTIRREDVEAARGAGPERGRARRAARRPEAAARPSVAD